MKVTSKEIILTSLVCILLTAFIFKDYFLRHSVPFPANLLVAYYEPWASYTRDGYPNGPPHKPIGFDSLRIYYPMRYLTTLQLKNLSLPLWNPYYFSGNTLLATYQSAIFHPLSWLFLILPQIDAWSIIIILAPIFCCLFTYLFLRTLSLSKRASFFGTLAFSFSGFMIVWWEESFMIVYSMLFLPLVLYAIEKIFHKLHFGYFIALIAGLSFSIFSGSFQFTFYVWIFSFVWAVYRYLSIYRKRKVCIYYILSGYVLAILIAGIHLIPSLEAYFYSSRGGSDVKQDFVLYLQPWYHLIAFLAPDFFGSPAALNYFGKGFYQEKVISIGIPALVFALYAFFFAKRSDGKETFFRWASVITTSLGFALPTSWFLLYTLKLPLVATLLPSRIFFLSTFCIAVLCAFGVEKFLKERDVKEFFITTLSLGAVFLTVWNFILDNRATNIANEYSQISFRNFILPSLSYGIVFLCMMLSFKSSLRKALYIAFVSLLVLEIVYFTHKYLYFSQREFVYPQTPVVEELQKVSGINRFWSIGRGLIDRNFSVVYQLFSPNGYDSFNIHRYAELVQAAGEKGKYPTSLARADTEIPALDMVGQISSDIYRKRLISLLGVKYVVEHKKKINGDITPILVNKDDFTLAWEDESFRIYQYTHVLPRFYLASNYFVRDSPQSILDAIFDEKTDLAKTVILEKNPADFSGGANDTQGEANLISYTPNEVTIATSVPASRILFLSDNFYPGWNAFLDGKEIPIYRANYSFRAVVVPLGQHLVRFAYKPDTFYIGSMVTGLGIILLVVFCLVLRKKR